MSTKLWFLTTIALMVIATPVSSTIIVVDWTGGGHHETIQDGIDSASPGDTVLVMPGTYAGTGIWCDNDSVMDNCIIAFGVSGEAVYCVGDAPAPTCCDIYGNAGGDWVGCLAGLDLVDNNFSEDPLFCDALAGDLTLDVASPCTANNAPSCGRVGTEGIGCETPVQTESRGAIKAMYR